MGWDLQLAGSQESASLLLLNFGSVNSLWGGIHIEFFPNKSSFCMESVEFAQIISSFFLDSFQYFITTAGISKKSVLVPCEVVFTSVNIEKVVWMIKAIQPVT